MRRFMRSSIALLTAHATKLVNTHQCPEPEILRFEEERDGEGESYEKNRKI